MSAESVSSLAGGPLPTLKGPLAARLLEFNLLPSRTLHPEQRPLLNPPKGLESAPPAVATQLHRRWSARLLEHLGAASAPIVNLTEPALALALCTPSQLRRLARDLGIALMGTSLRHLIIREDVMAARAALGETGMSWALDGAADLHPGLAHASRWLPNGWAQAAKSADLLGAGLLAQAWHDAPAPLRQRANWKLPLAALDAEHRTAAELIEPQARALCLTRLNQMDPSWLLCFP